jgi:hypothetical protein
MQSLDRMGIIFLVVGGLLGLLALGFGAAGVSQVASASASTGWTQTQGHIITSEVKFSEQHSSNEQSISYTANIVYEYTVSDKAYTSKQIKFGVDNASANTAQQLVNKYPVGSTVPVYYAPNDPRTAVLEPGVTAGSFGMLAFAGIFLIGAAVFGCVGFWLGGLRKGIETGEYQVEQGEGGGPVGTRRATIIRSTPKKTASRKLGASFSGLGIPFVITLLLAIVGTAILYIGVGDAREAFASPSWPRVQGTVVSYFIEQKESTDSNNNHTTIYTPRVVYRYQVNGVTYLGDRVTFEDVGSSGGVGAGFAPGQTVAVSYSPDDPNRAVLQPGAKLQSFWLLGVGGLFALLGYSGVASTLSGIVRGK